MSYEDFLKTNSPYNQTVTFEGTEDYLKEHNPEFLKKVDVDNTGLISFTEYFFFTVLLQAPSVKIRKAFKKYENQKMNKD